MAQSGDTITYTYSDGSVVIEDVSSVGKAIVDYLDGSGADGTISGEYGGRSENVTIDVSSVSSLYLWVGGTSGEGRYSGGSFAAGGTYFAGGSTEISFSNTDESDSSDEPVLVGAGGGGTETNSGVQGGGGGARGGVGGGTSGLGEDGSDGAGTPPPQGGDGYDSSTDEQETPGDGYINTGAPEVSGGTTTLGGGSPGGTDGEMQITYESLAPAAPSNVQITDAQTEGKLTVDWDAVSDATGYYVYRAESRGSAKADYTQVADVTSPPYTDVGLDDNQQYFYRVTSENQNGESDLSAEVNATTVLPSASDVNRTIRGANVEVNWNNDTNLGELEVQRSTDGFQTVETVESGLPGNTPSFLDRGPQRSQQVEYRVVRQDGNDTAESAPVQVELPTFAEIVNPGLGRSNKPRFNAIGVPSSASSVRFYRATGQQPVFPDEYTLLEESSTKISDFEDFDVSNDQYVSYAFTSVDSNGNESDPDIRQTFVPPQDATVVNMDEDT